MPDAAGVPGDGAGVRFAVMIAGRGPRRAEAGSLLQHWSGHPARRDPAVWGLGGGDSVGLLRGVLARWEAWGDGSGASDGDGEGGRRGGRGDVEGAAAVEVG